VLNESDFVVLLAKNTLLLLANTLSFRKNGSRNPSGKVVSVLTALSQKNYGTEFRTRSFYLQSPTLIDTFFSYDKLLNEEGEMRNKKKENEQKPKGEFVAVPSQQAVDPNFFKGLMSFVYGNKEESEKGFEEMIKSAGGSKKS